MLRLQVAEVLDPFCVRVMTFGVAGRPANWPAMLDQAEGWLQGIHQPVGVAAPAAAVANGLNSYIQFVWGQDTEFSLHTAAMAA